MNLFLVPTWSGDDKMRGIIPMRPPSILPTNLRIRTLMLGVAAVGLLLSALVRPEFTPRTTMTIVVGCICCLAFERFFLTSARARTDGVKIGLLGFFRRIGEALATASAIIGISVSAFMAGCYGYLWAMAHLIVASHWSPDTDPRYIATGFAIGMALSLRVARLARHALWTVDLSRNFRRLLGSRPVIVAVVIASFLGAHGFWSRYTLCRTMAAYHAVSSVRGDERGSAAEHRWLNRWYEKTAICPWLPIHPKEIPANP